MFGLKYVTKYEGVSIYETSRLGYGYNSAGLALPGFGIIIGDGTFSKAQDEDVVRHEFGHILQARTIGYICFYLFVGIPSLLSAWTAGWKKGHQVYWTEGWANHLSLHYFKDNPWPHRRFPPRQISPSKLWWIKWGI